MKEANFDAPEYAAAKRLFELIKGGLGTNGVFRVSGSNNKIVGEIVDKLLKGESIIEKKGVHTYIRVFKKILAEKWTPPEFPEFTKDIEKNKEILFNFFYEMDPNDSSNKAFFLYVYLMILAEKQKDTNGMAFENLARMLAPILGGPKDPEKLKEYSENLMSIIIPSLAAVMEDSKFQELVESRVAPELVASAPAPVSIPVVPALSLAPASLAPASTSSDTFPEDLNEIVVEMEDSDFIDLLTSESVEYMNKHFQIAENEELKEIIRSKQNSNTEIYQKKSDWIENPENMKMGDFVSIATGGGVHDNVIIHSWQEYAKEHKSERVCVIAGIVSQLKTLKFILKQFNDSHSHVNLDKDAKILLLDNAASVFSAMRDLRKALDASSDKADEQFISEVFSGLNSIDLKEIEPHYVEKINHDLLECYHRNNKKIDDSVIELFLSIQPNWPYLSHDAKEKISQGMLRMHAAQKRYIESLSENQQLSFNELEKELNKLEKMEEVLMGLSLLENDYKKDHNFVEKIKQCVDKELKQLLKDIKVIKRKKEPQQGISSLSELNKKFDKLKEFKNKNPALFAEDPDPVYGMADAMRNDKYEAIEKEISRLNSPQQFMRMSNRKKALLLVRAIKNRDYSTVHKAITQITPMLKGLLSKQGKLHGPASPGPQSTKSKPRGR